MQVAKPSKAEEDAFMASLLADIDDSFWNAQPSPDPSPVKRKSPEKPRRRISSPNKATRLPISPTRPPVTPPRAQNSGMAADFDMNTFLDGCDDWDLDNMSDMLSPQTSKPDQTYVESMPRYQRDPCTRCVVQSVFDEPNCKKLVVRLDGTGELRSVLLQDHWKFMDIRPSDIINVLGTFECISPSSSKLTSQISVTSTRNLLIHHPDILMTATAIANAPQCRRKPLLSALVRSSSNVTPALVWGNMLHEVMQSCFRNSRWDEQWFEERIDEVVLNGLGELVKIDASIEMAKSELHKRAAGLRAFSDRYIADMPKDNAELSDTRDQQGKKLLAIARIFDIEEDIWSPTFGLKGKLDATIDAVISERKGLVDKPVLRRGPRPFEIKTGRTTAVLEHRAQTTLYNLLAAERYGVEVPSGLLYYTQHDEVVNVPSSHHEVRGLLSARNDMAAYMMRRMRVPKRGAESDEEPPVEEAFLPPTIDDERVCKRCYALDTCMLYRKAVENVVDITSPIADTYDLKTGHLTPSQSAFFKKWEALIALEEQDLIRFRKELWTLGAAEREKTGRCFSSMVLDESFILADKEADAFSKIHSYTYRFARQGGASAGSLLNGHMSVGDAITVSIEPHLLALARGFILSLTPHEVVLGVDHELDCNMLRTRLALLNDTGVSSGPVVFRIDRDELFSGMGRVRDNLAQLFYADGDTARLRLVVDLQAPRFAAGFELSSELASYCSHLNVNQKEAVQRVLAAEDYALLLGMPGTGKTTVVAALIRVLVSMGKTVLLASYTHSAVDTILRKLKDDADFGILRLGNVDKVHPDVREYTLSARRAPTTIEQLDFQLMNPPVVATTCLSIDHIPARKGGLEVSLFRRLSDAHPEGVVDLTHQYRMNSDIMTLSNTLIYSNRLRCGSEEVANRSLVLPNSSLLDSLHADEASAQQCWLRSLLAESSKAVFVDTDGIPAHDSRVGDLVQNETEASLVVQLTQALLRSGVREEQIGIISLYRQQIKLLSHRLHGHAGIEILTADRSQGRDKDCIIISMVRSNDAEQVGDLVKDWRRMNVSFTRARAKLVIFGSRKTLQTTPLLKQFFTLMEGKGWILPLAKGAEAEHAGLFSLPSHPTGKSPGKRAATEAAPQEPGTPTKENVLGVRPVKKVRVRGEEGVLKGRPILQDLVNDDL
ncbi:AAA domain-containing protein [Schizophyllum amplum]|uniref:DNA replication ATP-dependent helicase/nuclease DNA2 n=1 Tax=Schizophyllum amplum TaxID=97359 RepID=A0A550BY01_9AGAR|nr:AAA domain-containing protein [Auriculariopsis ampla]